MTRRSTGSPHGAAPAHGRPRLPARAACAAVLALVLPTAPAAASPGVSPSADSSGAPSSPSTDPRALPQISAFPGTDAECVQSSATVSRRPWTGVSLGLEQARELDDGSGTTVAVLAPRISASPEALSDAVTGTSGEDCSGYGTFLAGVVGARPVSGSGFTGVAPAAEIVGIPVGNPRSGAVTAGEIASGIGDAVDAGADVVLVGTAAWEGAGALDDAVAAAASADALVVAPASVTPQGETLPGHPAQHPEVLSVGSYDPKGEPVLVSPLPLDGGGETARTDVTAPGSRVMGVGPDGGHYVGGGDGVAAAFAAGTAALVRSREPDLSAAEVRERLMATARGATLGASGEAVGRGPIDPVAALTNSPERGEPPAGGGARFVAAPPPEGTWDAPVTIAIAGGAGLVVVFCALGAVVLRRGRARAWRPAAADEQISPAPDDGDDG
ncbi:type VII secretion-associated serine protease mycosin [Streptomonospora halophila]|uniref:Type VII secretion-associated serine protease mycosin n=1 Tax=Streptomonospora halophila TaxID=427369 RepID=A0ABP9GJM4_9ACTN